MKSATYLMSVSCFYGGQQTATLQYIFSSQRREKTDVFSSVSPFALLRLFHPKERKMIVDKEHGHRNCIIPLGSYLEEPSVNRAKHKAKYGRIISGIFYSNETEQNLSLSGVISEQ